MPLGLPPRRQHVVPVEQHALQLVELGQVGLLDVRLGEQAKVRAQGLVPLCGGLPPVDVAPSVEPAPE